MPCIFASLFHDWFQNEKQEARSASADFAEQKTQIPKESISQRAKMRSIFASLFPDRFRYFNLSKQHSCRFFCRKRCSYVKRFCQSQTT